jgi:hypothetical protein
MLYRSFDSAAGLPPIQPQSRKEPQVTGAESTNQHSPAQSTATLQTVSLDFSTVDPSTLYRRGVETYQDILKEDRKSISFSVVDLVLNHLLTLPSVIGAIQGDADSLSFYKAHRFLNSSLIPGFACAHIEQSARSAFTTAHHEFESWAKQKFRLTIPRHAQIYAARISDHLKHLGLNQICSFKEAEEVHAYAKTAVERSKDPGIKLASRGVKAGFFLLSDSTAFGIRAVTSFANRANQMLVASLLSDFTVGVRPHFVIPEKVLLQLLETNEAPQKLTQDRTMRNLISYAGFFSTYPEIPRVQRDAFVARYHNEPLGDLALAVEFLDYLPKVKEISPPAIAPKTTSVARPSVQSKEPLLQEQVEASPSPSSEIGFSGTLERLVAGSLTTAERDCNDVASLSASLRGLMRSEVLTYPEIYQALVTNKISALQLVAETKARLAEKAQGEPETSTQNAEKPRGYTLRFFTQGEGERCPFQNWLTTLTPKFRERVEDRLEQAKVHGEFIETRHFKGYPGVYEFRFGDPSESRVYFSYGADRSLIIWNGGPHDQQEKILENIDRWRKRGVAT